MQPSTLSRVAVAVGLPERYRYWSGHSRRRYLFSRTLPSAMADYEDAVVMMVREGQVLWVGEPAGSVALRPEQAEDYEIFVHLLAASAEERRRIVADLRPNVRTLALAA